MNLESGDVITTAHKHFYSKGSTIEIYSASGEKRGAVKVCDVPTATTLTVREMIWREKVWYLTQRGYRWLKRKVLSKN